MRELHEQVYDDLLLDEGDRDKPYDDATGKELKPGDVLKGNITIGRGVNLSAGLMAGEGFYLGIGRIQRVGVDLNNAYPWWISRPDPVRRGMWNMAYNMGIHRLGEFKRMLACIQAGDYGGAADAALDSLWADQVGARAKRIADLYRSCIVKTGATS